MEEVLQSYKKNLDPNEELKARIWDDIEAKLPETKKSRLWGFSLGWKGLIVASFFVIGGLSLFSSISFLSTQNQEQQGLDADIQPEDESRSIVEEDVSADNFAMDQKVLSITPAEKYLDNIRPGEKISLPVQIAYNGENDITKILIEVVDFDIDRVNCSNTKLSLNQQTSNSALSWVRTSSLVNVSKGNLETVEVQVTIPPNAQAQTYWFAVTATEQENPDNTETSLFFVTVGENRSEKCLTTTDLHYQI